MKRGLSMERKIADTRHGYLAKSSLRESLQQKSPKGDIPIGDKIGNEGTLKIKGTCEEPIYIIREASNIPVPALKKGVPKEVKEPNGHLNEKELLRMAYERWEKRFN